MSTSRSLDRKLQVYVSSNDIAGLQTLSERTGQPVGVIVRDLIRRRLLVDGLLDLSPPGRTNTSNVGTFTSNFGR